MPATLQLRLIAATAPLPVRAGFLPGSDTGAWLEEMSRHPGGRFFIVPESVEDAEPGGLLLLPAAQRETPPVFGPRVLPCVLEHGRVAVLAGLRLDPLLTTEEVERLLNYDAYFFHPALGLVAFEKADAITAEALVVPPLLHATSWLGAEPGPPPQPPLRQVLLAVTTGDAGLFGDAAKDIGSQSPKDLQKGAPLLDKLKDKLASGLAGAGSVALGGLAGAAGMLGGLGAALAGGAKGGASAGRSGQGPGPLQRFQQWTAQQLADLQRRREREIQRLLKMLDSDPDRGLRYAVPFGSQGRLGRGPAPPPGGRLTERTPVFGARRGGGAGGAADVWNFSEQTQWALQTKYRNLANREMAEGRFDRAAYIFADLLGDWHAAAAALIRGRRFQEAAQIYSQQLNNKPMAAKCLEDGGLLADAVLIYAELGQHEKCGDLLRQLGREREAVAAYHDAIKTGGGDRLHDARILFEKLQQHDLALAVLAAGYPASSQARQCLEKHFEYLARLHATDAALALAGSLADPARQISWPVTMAETLHAIHRMQTEPAVAARLATVALQVIGTALTTSQGNDRHLLKLLPDFAPSDRLLKRDSARYLDLRQARARMSGAGSASNASSSLVFRRALKLPRGGIEWSGLISRGETWLATGYHAGSRQDVWAMGKADRILGKLTSAHGWACNLPLPPLLPQQPDLAWLPLAPQGVPARYGQARAADFSFVPGSREQFLTQLAWLPAHVLAACPVANGHWILHGDSSNAVVVLSFHALSGGLVRTRALGWKPPALAEPVRMVCHGDDIFISTGAHLLHVKHGNIEREIGMPGPVASLSASRSVQPPAALTVADGDASLHTPGKKGESVHLFSGTDTKACFLGDGSIVVGDSTELLVYTAVPETKHKTTLKLAAGKPPLAACAAFGAHGLGLLRQDGTLEIYE